VVVPAGVAVPVVALGVVPVIPRAVVEGVAAPEAPEPETKPPAVPSASKAHQPKFTILKGRTPTSDIRRQGDSRLGKFARESTNSAGRLTWEHTLVLLRRQSWSGL
jgi:hypothetical protein